MFDLTLGVGPLKPLAAQLGACGVDPVSFFAGRGIDFAVLSRRDGRVPLFRLIGIWERAAEAAGDPYFGLNAGARLEPGVLGVVSDLSEASSTLGDAFAQLSRYLRIVTETVALRVRVEGPIATVEPRFRMPPFAQGRHAVEFTVAALAHFSRSMVRQPVSPRRATFRHRRAAPRDGYLRVFGAPCEFDAAQTGLELDAALLHSALKRGSPERAAALDAAAHRVLTTQPRAGTTTEQVARVAMGELRLGVEPGVDSVAAELATSARSLQRALRHEGATFASVVDSLRLGLALHHLGEAELSIDEVAFVLGFSETAAFYRAFKRWTGTTPAAHRARQSGA